MADAETPDPEREQTDESLRAEREKADVGLAERQTAVEHVADEVIQKAREQADAVVVTARDRADRQLEAAESTIEAASEIAAVTEERVLEDEVLRQERSRADEALLRDREHRAKALLRLLPFERDKTDLHLLTERVRSDIALSNRDDFLGNVSHDLRNLLSGIVMSAADLAETPEEEALGRITESTETILRYAARMNRLIGDLIDVVSIDAGTLAVIPAERDCQALILEGGETFRLAAASRGISLEIETTGTPLVAEFDHGRILQVLANLIGNSLKFTAAGGTISVRAERKGDDVLVTVQDTGVGVPPRLREAIFERFWQVGKDDRRGLGLGLYISRCIVEAHGGRIWAEGEEGKGSEFLFTLPALAAAGKSASRVD